MQKDGAQPAPIDPQDLVTDTRAVLESLTSPDGHSYSSTFADYAIPDEELNISRLTSSTKRGHMFENFRSLRKAGWDGLTCIGPISPENAITIFRNGQKVSDQCGAIIPEERKEAQPGCYRCTQCEEKLEHQRNKR